MMPAQGSSSLSMALTAEEVRKFVLGSPIKTSVLDPLPTAVLRDVVDDCYRSSRP